MTAPSVVLVGMPGAGKSAVAALLCERWGAHLVETDDIVAETLGISLDELYAEPDGEARFRRAEQDAALQALAGDGVVALGSGAVESPAVRDALQGHRVIWLRVSVRAATRRLGMAKLGIEVLVAIRNRLDGALAQRAGWYADVATASIDTDRLRPEAIAELIAEGEAP